MPGPAASALAANPLLALLARRGRAEVVEVLRRHPGRTWRVRELAELAGVPPMAASRAVRELAALGAAETLRPGREARVRWLPESAAGAFLAGLEPPALRELVCATFTGAYARPPGVVQVAAWRLAGDDEADPLCPVRIAVVTRRNEEAASEALGPALDAVRAAGLPAPEVATHLAAALQVSAEAGDAVARAVLAGRPI